MPSVPKYRVPSRTLLHGRYRLIADINKGSYGVVSLAKDTKANDTLVAIKCIATKPGSEHIARREARHEIAMHKRLGAHRNIMSLVDYFEADGKVYLVLEYCAHGDLYEAIKAGKGPREQGCILDFMLQLVDAVAYSHSKGIYHRDIKPENILIGADGCVKLADWGLATTAKLNHDFGVGSERYMAPELFDEANIADYDAEKADIWALGICLLNILFGRNPFTVASQRDKLFLDFSASRETLFDIFPTMSSDVFAVLRYCLTMDPDNRSLIDMRAELVRAQTWTTDEEFYDEDLFEADTAPVQSETVDEPASDAEAQPGAGHGEPIIFTTTNRQPLRTPSRFADHLHSRSSFDDPDWSRTMQFTPPSHGPMLFSSKIKQPSSLSHVRSAGRRSSSFGPVAEEAIADDDLETPVPLSEANSGLRSRGGRRRGGSRTSTSSFSGSSISEEELLDDDDHDDVFAMDGDDTLGMSGQFTKIAIDDKVGDGPSRAGDTTPSSSRVGSGSNSSSSSVPSRVPSLVTTSDAASTASVAVPWAKPSVARDVPLISQSVSPRIAALRSDRDKGMSGGLMAGSAPVAQDFLNFGKSWGDVDFDDDNESEGFAEFLRASIPALKSNPVVTKTPAPASSVGTRSWVLSHW